VLRPAARQPESIFAAILDAQRGGHWRVAPAGGAETTRRYVGASAVLETEHRGDGNRLKVTDFMPIRRGRDGEPSRSADSLVRIIECTDGEVELECEWVPRPDYARADVRFHRAEGGVVAVSPQGEFWLTGIPEAQEIDLSDGLLRLRRRMQPGETLVLACSWGRARPQEVVAQAHTLREETIAWWEDWVSVCGFEPRDRRHRELVVRSGMVLKILTNEKTGAMAAAPTTSLPEEIGGVRNWDYRYCWVRDAGMTARAFATLGHSEDGVRFLHFLEDAARQHRDPHRIQVMYGLHAELEMPEFTLGHLEGYRGSRPVHIGNEAAHQRQLDVWGELIESAYDLFQMDAELPPEHWDWIRGITDHVCDAWRGKGSGIWEIRSGERHFTHSKVKCWVALDRAIRMAEADGWEVDTRRWKQECKAIREAVLENGFDRQKNSFVQAFDCDALDASNLLIPIVGFLPGDDPRIQGTLDATLQGLTENGLVYRYIPEEANDGVAAARARSCICTFWLAEALALAGRLDEAHEIFEGVLDRVNDVGLLPSRSTRRRRVPGQLPAGVLASSG
jgi:GH15 family glucan-1,4-alpha-glucosidase